MSEKLSPSTGSRSGRDVPLFTVAPPVRCFFVQPGVELQICGELARWMRPGPAYFSSGYFCDRHRAAGDVKLPAVRVLRRVRLLATIDLAGVSWLSGASHAEAFGRLDRAVQDAGGLLNVNGVVSAIGEYRPCPPSEDENGG